MATSAAGTRQRTTAKGSVVSRGSGGSSSTVSTGRGPRAPAKVGTPAAPKAKAPAKPKAAKPRRRVIYPGGKPRGNVPQTSRQITPGQVARAPGQAAAAVTQREGRYSAKHMLTAELLAGVLIVAIRAVADYEPQADGTLKGKVGHPKGQYGPLPILTGLIVVFFLLSFAAASGGLKAKLAVIAGAVIDLGLLFNSSAEFEKVSKTFGKLGKARVPPGAWQTQATGLPAAGTPISGTLGGGSPGGGGPTSTNPKFPLPPGAIAVPPGGCPSNYLEENDGHGHNWCAPINS